jgi:ubiquinone/menaquinone biosynthesis C-methylase UbiE
MTEQRDFDAAAATWDEEPRRVQLSGEIAAAIQSRIPLSAEWQAMDFGCGTGLVTLRLAPHLAGITAVDSSQKMLEQLELKRQQLGLTSVHTLPAAALLGSQPAEQFNLITSAMTLHHIEDPAALLGLFFRLLLPGGRIALADLETEDGSFHEDPTGVFHHGFSSHYLTELLEGAGFCNVSVTRITEISKGERRYPVLLATAAVTGA